MSGHFLLQDVYRIIVQYGQNVDRFLRFTSLSQL